MAWALVLVAPIATTEGQGSEGLAAAACLESLGANPAGGMSAAELARVERHRKRRDRLRQVWLGLHTLNAHVCCTWQREGVLLERQPLP